MKNKSGKILIIDDELDICILLSSVLKSLGYKTDYAGSVSKGVEKALETKPSILFLDINLPDGKGLDLIPIIKEKNLDPEIILISANEMDEYKEVAEENGVHHFLGKPFSKNDIVEALSAVS